MSENTIRDPARLQQVQQEQAKTAQNLAVSNSELVRISTSIAEIDNQIKDVKQSIEDLQSKIRDANSKIDDLREQRASLSLRLQKMVSEFIKPDQSGVSMLRGSGRTMRTFMSNNSQVVVMIDSHAIYKNVLDFIYSQKEISPREIADYLSSVGSPPTSARTVCYTYIKYLTMVANPKWSIIRKRTLTTPNVYGNPLVGDVKIDLSTLSPVDREYAHKALKDKISQSSQVQEVR